MTHLIQKSLDKNRTLGALLALAAVLLLALVAGRQVANVQAAGASYGEDFEDVGPVNEGDDGPSNLIADGWTFRNQSDPEGPRGWFGLEGDAYTGNAYLAANYNSTVCGAEAAISTWAILPAIPDQAAGDPLSFAVIGGSGGRVDRLQVRYSPTGGTDTGSGPGDVGDFTDLLLDWESERFSTRAWETQSVSLPGDGRIAFRYFLPNADACTSYAYLLGIDNLVVGDPPAGPYPLPQAGETVTWDASISPIVIDGRQVIVEGGTVQVEPGVEIQVLDDSSLVVEGALQGDGTADNPITVTAPTVFPPAIEVFGALDLNHADISGQIRPAAFGELVFNNTSFHGNGTVFTGSSGIPRFFQIDNSTFNGVDLGVTAPAVILRNVTLTNASARVGGYPHLDGVTVDGGTFTLSKDHQPGYVDNVTVRNAPGAGLVLGGGQVGNDFLLGPNVTLENNAYPALIANGGLLPGSNVPATGNQNNVVAVSGGADQRGPATWGDVGVPYQVNAAPSLLGRWEILPGTTVQFAPGAGISAEDGTLVARGLPGAPITFKRAQPDQAWGSLVRPNRLEHVVVEGSDLGLIYSSTGLPRFVDSAILRNNNRALIGSAIVRSTQFLDNVTGAVAGFPTDLNGETNPNSFVGNTDLAVESADDATHNWWGDRSGPSGPQNKRGTGDPVADGVPVKPFLKQAPDYSDSPPIVRMNGHHFLAEPGDKIMLTWNAEDDVSISSQRILFSPDSNNPLDYTVIADNLPGDQRAYEWTVPNTGFQRGAGYIRIEAVDDDGRVGWDHRAFLIPSDEVTGEISITSDLTGPFQAGDDVEICWNVQNEGLYANSVDAWLFLENGQRTLSLGGSTTDCLPLGLNVPAVSTDNARVGVRLYGTGNRVRWAFSDPFTIQLDDRLPGAPPAVSLDSPTEAINVAPDSVVPISWTASDDVALRSFDVHASYDGGRTWHVIAEDLPASARSFDWQTAPGTGFDGVHLRVVAVDRHFRDASASTLGNNDPAPTATATPTTAPTATPTMTPTPSDATATPTPTATATATATPTPTPEPADTVTIEQAEYRTNQNELRVEANGSDPSAQLDVYVTATGEFIGTLEGDGRGRYRGRFDWPTNPQEITVRSSLGGSDTATVEVK